MDLLTLYKYFNQKCYFYYIYKGKFYDLIIFSLTKTMLSCAFFMYLIPYAAIFAVIGLIAFYC